MLEGIFGATTQRAELAMAAISAAGIRTAMADRLGARRLPGPGGCDGRTPPYTGNAFLECGHETTAHRQNYSFRNLAWDAIFRPRRTDLEAECDASYRRFSRHGWGGHRAPAPDAPAGFLEARPIGTGCGYRPPSSLISHA